MTASIPDTRRREIFKALVETQDDGITVAQSRERIARRYDVDVEQVVAIEREGVKATWPPLDITFPEHGSRRSSPNEPTNE